MKISEFKKGKYVACHDLIYYIGDVCKAKKELLLIEVSFCKSELEYERYLFMSFSYAIKHLTKSIAVTILYN